MNKKRFSLMTFPMEIDLWAKKLSIENLFELAEENEISKEIFAGKVEHDKQLKKFEI